MLVRSVSRLALLCAVCFVASCGGPRPGPNITKVPVVAVSGNVTVDGKPESGVIIQCVPTGSFEQKDLSKALGGRTDENGDFTLGTYEIADGVPPGDYALTFIWPAPNFRKQSRAEDEKSDRLHGKYSKADRSPSKISVKTDEPLTLDPLDLKTK